MTLYDWAREIHANAVDKGWWETDRPLPEILMLCVSELAEALEAYRIGAPDECITCTADPTGENCIESACCFFQQGKCVDGKQKPNGIAVEMADCIIRILDYAGRMGWDMDGIVAAKHEYNKNRPYRHGGKRA